MKNLLERSFKLVDGMDIERNGEFSKLQCPYDPNLELCYNYNNGIIRFVYQGEQYVCPAEEDYFKVLKDNGFRKESMYVPFSNWDMPRWKIDEYERVFKYKKPFPKEEPAGSDILMNAATASSVPPLGQPNVAHMSITYGKVDTRIRQLKAMHELMCLANDESIAMAWLQGGVPDSPTDDDYNFIANDDSAYTDCFNLFTSLITRKGYN